MALSQVSTTGWGYGAAAPTRVLGTAAAGDIRIALVIVKPGTATVSLNQGFVKQGEMVSSTGVPTGADVGPTRVQIWTKILTDTSDNGLTLTATVTGGSIAAMNTFLARKAADKAWGIQIATGEDLTGAASWSAVLSPDLVLPTGALIYAQSAIPTDVTTPAQFTAEAFTASGITFNAGNKIIEADSSTGNDIGGHGHRTSIASGSGSAVQVTYSATASGTVTNVYGPTACIVLTEETPPAPDYDGSFFPFINAA